MEFKLKYLHTIKTFFFIVTFFFVVLEVLSWVTVQFFQVYNVEITKYSLNHKVSSSNPLIGFIHRPNTSGTYMGVKLKFNSLGLRESEFSPKDLNEADVFLGDSLTLGWGVKEEETFAKQSEILMKSKVINLGHGNYNVERSANFLKVFLEEVGVPKSVSFFYFINDAEDLPKFENSKWYHHSNLLMLGHISFQGFGKVKDYKDYYKSLYIEESSGLKKAKKSLSLLKNLSEKYGFSFQVFILPELHQISPYPFNQEHQAVANYLLEQNVKYWDLTDQFLSYQKEPKELWVSIDDAHPNAKAHKIIADFVSKKLIMQRISHASE